MRFISLSIFLLLCTITEAQSLTDNRQLFYDRLTDTYLCSVDKSEFDNGNVSAFKCDTANICFTFLPILHLSGEFGYDYANGEVTLAQPDGTTDKAMTAKIKWRGGTSNAEDRHKRNYHIKFIDADGKKQDRSFFNLRKANSWLLDAGQIDMSRIRNRVAMDLWRDLGTLPYYSDNEPNLRTYTRGEFVELFLNDEYRGIYCLSENIDRSQLKLKKNDDDEIHGMLWKAKNFQYTRFTDFGDYDNTLGVWGGFELKYPDIEDVPVTDWSVLYDAVVFASQNQGFDFYEHMNDIYDMPVIKDYFLFTQVLWALDNTCGKNCLWACYDTKKDRKITLVPWDLDCTAGQHFSNANHMHEEATDPTLDYMYLIGEIITSRLYEQYTTETGFVNPADYSYLEEAASRYNLLRKDIFSYDSLVARYDHYMDMLRQSGAYERETARWSGDSDIEGQTLDFAQEQTYIHEWFAKHLVSLDKQFSAFVVNGIKNANTENTNAHTIYNINGTRVDMPYSSLKKGVYIINGKKVVK